MVSQKQGKSNTPKKKKKCMIAFCWLNMLFMSYNMVQNYKKEGRNVNIPRGGNSYLEESHKDRPLSAKSV